MQLSFSASGPKTTALTALQSQRAAAVTAQPDAHAVADAVLSQIVKELDGVSDDASVSISASVWVGVTKPALEVE